MRGDTSIARSWLARIGWMIMIWTSSVMALGVFALAFRCAMMSAGLTP
jgi:hypothetical protein